MSHPQLPWRILLTGPPQCGKTTVIKKVVMSYSGQCVGFYTEEVRRHGRRLGFEIITLNGRRGWLSHVDFPGPPRVGKYGVDLKSLHRLALPALTLSAGVDLVIIDEIGKMECLSPQFIAAVERLWFAPVPMLMTVADRGGGFSQQVKTWPGALLIPVTPSNRNELPTEILRRLASPPRLP